MPIDLSNNLSSSQMLDNIAAATADGSHLKLGSDNQIHTQSKFAHFFETMFSSKATLIERSNALKGAILEKLQHANDATDANNVNNRYQSLFADNNAPVTRQEFKNRLLLLKFANGIPDEIVQNDAMRQFIAQTDFKSASATRHTAQPLTLFANPEVRDLLMTQCARAGERSSALVGHIISKVGSLKIPMENPTTQQTNKFLAVLGRNLAAELSLSKDALDSLKESDLNFDDICENLDNNILQFLKPSTAKVMFADHYQTDPTRYGAAVKNNMTEALKKDLALPRQWSDENLHTGLRKDLERGFLHLFNGRDTTGTSTNPEELRRVEEDLIAKISDPAIRKFVSMCLMQSGPAAVPHMLSSEPGMTFPLFSNGPVIDTTTDADDHLTPLLGKDRLVTIDIDNNNIAHITTAIDLLFSVEKTNVGGHHHTITVDVDLNQKMTGKDIPDFNVTATITPLTEAARRSNNMV